MAYLVLITVTAAFLAGILALPFTMPRGALADHRAGPGATAPETGQSPA